MDSSKRHILAAIRDLFVSLPLSPSRRRLLNLGLTLGETEDSGPQNSSLGVLVPVSYVKSEKVMDRI